jgi:hypothetical protein
MDRRLNLALLMFLSVSRITSAQLPVAIPSNAAPQSARQALLEMVFAVKPSQFFSHLSKHAQQLMKADVNILPLQDFASCHAVGGPDRKETLKPVLSCLPEEPYSRRIVEARQKARLTALMMKTSCNSPCVHISKRQAEPFLVPMRLSLKNLSVVNGAWMRCAQSPRSAR